MSDDFRVAGLIYVVKTGQLETETRLRLETQGFETKTETLKFESRDVSGCITDSMSTATASK